MATNVPAKNFDVVRVNLTGAAETPIVLPVNTIRFLAIQCYTAVDVYLSFQAGGTWSTDNFWTVKSGQILVLEDIASQPKDAVAGGGTMFYARGGATCVIEVLYGQG